MITKLNENNFSENIKKGLKLVEFFAPWCSHCQRQEPILEQMKDIWIGQVNSDVSPQLLQQFRIQGFPTFVLFNDGLEVQRFSGEHSKYEIMEIITKYLK